MKVHVSKVLKFMMIFERDKPYDSSNVDVLQTVRGEYDRGQLANVCEISILECGSTTTSRF